MKYVIAHFSYKVKSFILFCNLLALTFFKSFFFSAKGVSLPKELDVFLKGRRLFLKGRRLLKKTRSCF